MREWIYGRNPVFEALVAERRQVFRLRLAEGVQEKGRISQILLLSNQRKIPMERVTRRQLDIQYKNNQGVLAEVSSYPYVNILDILESSAQKNEPPFLLLLDILQDPQNLGTLLRTAEAVGVHGVIIPLRQTTTVTPAVVNASSGASEHLLLAQENLVQAIKIVKDQGIWVVGLSINPNNKTIDASLLNGPIAIVVGSEGGGLRHLVQQSCDVMMHIPMRGKIGSLNASVAGSVALYQVWQARGYNLNK